MQTPDATLSHATTTTDATLSHTTTTHPATLSHATPGATLSHATTTTTTDTTLSHTTPHEFDFDNDDDAFYNFIEFGIASNGGRLSIW